MNLDFEWFQRLRARYALRAVLIGLIFPVLVTVVSVITRGLPLNLQTIFEVQRTQATLWVINTVPLFLGIIGYVLGLRQESVVQLIDELEFEMALRTDELIAANEEIQKVLADIRVIRITAQEELAAQKKFTDAARLRSFTLSLKKDELEPEEKKAKKPARKKQAVH